MRPHGGTTMGVSTIVLQQVLGAAKEAMGCLIQPGQAKSLGGGIQVAFVELLRLRAPAAGGEEETVMEDSSIIGGGADAGPDSSGASSFRVNARSAGSRLLTSHRWREAPGTNMAPRVCHAVGLQQSSSNPNGTLLTSIRVGWDETRNIA